MDLGSCRILVTPTSFGRMDPRLRRRLEEQCGEVIYNETGKLLAASQVKELLPGVDGYIAGVDAITSEALQAADRLKVIARYGVGVDKVDLDAARRRGIVVTNTPGANSASVAELTIGLMLSLLRNIPNATAATRAASWPRMNGLAIRKKTVGVIGLGAVGRCVAERLAPFECTLLGFDPYAAKSTEESTGITMTSLENLLARSDVVTLHVPSTVETRGIANDRFFDAMKKGAYLVNTARGELIEEAALLRAIDTGRLAGAALDVFEQEPLPAESPLLRSEKIIATPHMAAHTDDAVTEMAEIATADCLAVLRGEKPKHPVI